ncbi:uncharacterized protein [Leptinotarsa decemlineata]|uniref:uncharacterized protein n=1 Tax=Leptinotarsa decemlineata TaxID=7539 RepID=UPI003D309D1A
MSSSLDTLVSYLSDFPNLISQFSNLSNDQQQILTKKGVMPYDYIDSFEKFNEDCLPPIETFYNKLEDKPCPRRSYSRAKLIWTTFKINTLGEYTDLYLKTDVMLLADVFEQFRSSCHKTYGLDPAHYFTLPGYTWDAMLFKTKHQLELLTDVDQLLFFEKGTRGGLSQVCSKRRVTANNKYMGDNYDRAKADSYLMYFDVNNQYGWAMSQYLPYGGFEWMDTNIDITNVPDDASEGYILEVDLEYPNSLHDMHKDLPFCPDHVDPKTKKSRAESTSDVKQFKLMATLQSKKKYVIHYRNLKQALEHGLILKKIHRVLKFKQSTWLKPYIDLNTRLRTAASNDFEKNLFKLMNNAVFGKTMENLRKHSDVRLVTSWDGRYGAEARISNPRFKSLTVFDENLAAIELGKSEIFFNKPIYVGMVVLDLAKLTTYNFHYEYMAPRFGENFCAVYTDTDSLIYEIINYDPYEMMKNDCHQYFDTSDYQSDNIYDIPRVNKKVIGLMKDENNGKLMIDFIGLRSKLYSTKTATSEDQITDLKERLKQENYENDEINQIVANFGVSKKAKVDSSNAFVVQRNTTDESYGGVETGMSGVES